MSLELKHTLPWQHIMLFRKQFETKLQCISNSIFVVTQTYYILIDTNMQTKTIKNVPCYKKMEFKIKPTKQRIPESWPLAMA